LHRAFGQSDWEKYCVTVEADVHRTDILEYSTAPNLNTLLQQFYVILVTPWFTEKKKKMLSAVGLTQWLFENEEDKMK
jgi:hypothetical protein